MSPLMSLGSFVHTRGCLVWKHPMITRAKFGICKSKTYLAATQDSEPTSIKAALSKLTVVYGYKREIWCSGKLRGF